MAIVATQSDTVTTLVRKLAKKLGVMTYHDDREYNVLTRILRDTSWSCGTPVPYVLVGSHRRVFSTVPDRQDTLQVLYYKLAMRTGITVDGSQWQQNQRLRQLLALTCGGVTPPEPPPGPTENPVVTDWAARVVTNGGAEVSIDNREILSTFMDGLDAAGLTNKMVVLNLFVPDNLIAACTPLIVNAGNDPWTNANFVAGDLTTHGLKGNGTNKYLNTGVITSTLPAPFGRYSAGVSMMFQHDVPFTNGVLMSAAGSATGSAFGTATLNTPQIYGNVWGTSAMGVGDHVNWTSGNGIANPWSGFVSHSRNSTTDYKMYAARVTVTPLAFTQVASVAVAPNGNVIPTYPMYVFCQNAVGTANFFSAARLSFAAVHSGLDATETETLYNLVAAARTGIGAGNF